MVDLVCTFCPCMTETAERLAQDAGLYNSNYSVNADLLRSFRDHYLRGKPKGDYYIDLYYTMSYRISTENFSADFAVTTLELIEKEIIPLTKALLANPNANKVLYDKYKADIVIKYLNEAKELYTDEESIAQIDRIISEVEAHVNQTNADITAYLSN